MVSECKKEAVVRSTFDKFEMTELPEPLPVRIKFRKVGNLQYISHLDLQRVVGRILIRSGVPVWFTQGFNPHPKIVFALPLSVGAQSECEYVDIKIDRRISHKEIAERLNAQVTDEMKILSVYRPETKFSEIAYVRYEITLYCDGITDETPAAIEKLFTESPLNMTKRSKSGEKEIDVIPYIKSVTAKRDADSLTLAVVLNGGEGSLNPEMLVTAMREKLGLLSRYPDSDSYSILRTNVYFEDMKEFE